ncbi:aldehyde dehydrogenase (NADP(+)) [Rugamonas apoptosis]|uniref:Aldehyde dehydrogenase (NADP(+)) n=1 Tax=Rugamonas apoptosis TaxID=2758570 RepID=A0A7W2IMS9_9BURK|nr:aldehyde dehydrogenase (NADP(+)) [Rugamonas apoptosis]MBA5689822.1 aldehyde dehydrogenase (NADP(+)) [Rugamonas apoptosis]
MIITGEAIIGGMPVRGKGQAFTAWSAAEARAMEPAFHAVDATQIDLACKLAEAAFDPFRASSDDQRATLLETIGHQIEELGDALIERACAESGLPRARIEGERTRTVNQLKLFANLLRAGAWNEAVIDRALPERVPPRQDLRRRMIGLGPVAVFGASNFPLAFSVAGGDTASALAAGCPVLVKAHPAHPGTSELVARAVAKALAQCQMPAGAFALLTGAGNEVGQELVRHPAVKAVGFTGSRAGGVALMALAAARPQPIPVYAEMSSINPVFLLPAALAARCGQIATDFAASLTMGVGQFCTNPGLLLALDGPDLERFELAAALAVAEGRAAPMLTPGIAQAYQRGMRQLADHPQVATLAMTAQLDGKGAPALFRTSADAFLAQHALSDEVFGPAALLVVCRDMAQMRHVAERLEGQLTATLQMEEGDVEAAQALLPVLERKAGRILANGFPTGVEVAAAMVHGGPFPATSDGRSTSVGTAAIVRFLRPVAYQNLPQALLPAVLRDDNDE